MDATCLAGTRKLEPQCGLRASFPPHKKSPKHRGRRPIPNRQPSTVNRQLFRKERRTAKIAQSTRILAVSPANLVVPPERPTLPTEPTPTTVFCTWYRSRETVLPSQMCRRHSDLSIDDHACTPHAMFDHSSPIWMGRGSATTFKARLHPGDRARVDRNIFLVRRRAIDLDSSAVLCRPR